MPQRLSTTDTDFEARFSAVLSMKREDAPDVGATVAAIIADVRERGDAAVLELTERFDRLALTPETLAFSEAEIDAACASVPEGERRRWNSPPSAFAPITSARSRRTPPGPTRWGRNWAGGGRLSRRRDFMFRAALPPTPLRC